MTNPTPKINGTRRRQLQRELVRVALTEQGRALLQLHEQLRELRAFRAAARKHFPIRR